MKKVLIFLRVSQQHILIFNCVCNCEVKREMLKGSLPFLLSGKYTHEVQFLHLRHSGKTG